jgi:hypothetical protein
LSFWRGDDTVLLFIGGVGFARQKEFK